MKVKHLHIYGTPARLKHLKEEYDWIARNRTKMEGDNHLIVFNYAPKFKKKKNEETTAEAQEKPSRRTNSHSKQNKSRKVRA